MTATAAPSVTRSVTRLPTYALYGEAGRGQATEPLHCERIAERSQRHDWEIALHRHESLFQILHIQHGTAQASLDTRQWALKGPCVLLAPALTPHGFVFAPDIEGTVITVLEPYLARLLHAAPLLMVQLLRPRVWQWSEARHASALVIDAAVARLRADYAEPGAWRDLALDAALLQLALLLGRLAGGEGSVGGVGGVGGVDATNGRGVAGASAVAPAQAARATGAAGTRGLAHVQRFRALVEQRFRSQPALAALARELGITPTQLNRVCHQVLGHSALGVLHGRLVLEAQRDLAYTTLAIKQIAHGLGFADAGYFTRFFQRQTGHTPSAWRALSAR